MISFSDYMTNNTGNGQAPVTESQQKYYQNTYDDNVNREKNMEGIQGWEQSRNPYYASLYSQQTGAANKQAQQGYNDSLKKLQLQHLGRGTSGGSQELYNQSQLGAHYQQQAARGAQQAQNYVQGIRQNDQGRASQMRMDQYQQDPAMASYYDSLQRLNNVNGDAYTNQVNGQMADYDINQYYQNMMSQNYGQAINNGMSGAQSFAGMAGGA